MNADIDKANADAENLKGEIKELEAAIATADDELKAATKIRNKENVDYKAVHMDLSESVDALARAIEVLKSKDAKIAQASLLQIQNMPQIPEHEKAVIASFLRRLSASPMLLRPRENWRSPRRPRLRMRPSFLTPTPSALPELMSTRGIKFFVPKRSRPSPQHRRSWPVLKCPATQRSTCHSSFRLLSLSCEAPLWSANRTASVLLHCCRPVPRSWAADTSRWWPLGVQLRILSPR